MNLRLDWCSTQAARYACKQWHYARRYPASKSARVGVWEDGAFVGVVMITVGSGGVGKIHKSFSLPAMTVAELQRVALCRHETPVTRIVAIALRMIKRQSPGLELVISYADPAQGHRGVIYEAGNWTRFGWSGADVSYRFADGRIFHSRGLADKKQFGRPIGYGVYVKKSAVEVISLPPKRRFLYPLGARGRAICEELRAKQAIVADHAASGGAAPTGTLQLVA